MTEAEVAKIVKRWEMKPTESLTGQVIDDIQDFFALVKALREAWAETARVKALVLDDVMTGPDAPANVTGNS